jgi:hypothetical protein
MLGRQPRPAQDFIKSALHHPQHQSREAGSCLGAKQPELADERTRFAGGVQGIDGRVVAQLVWLD